MPRLLNLLALIFGLAFSVSADVGDLVRAGAQTRAANLTKGSITSLALSPVQNCYE